MNDPERKLTPDDLDDLDDADAYNEDGECDHDPDPWGELDDDTEEWVTDEDAQIELLAQMDSDGEFI